MAPDAIFSYARPAGKNETSAGRRACYCRRVIGRAGSPAEPVARRGDGLATVSKEPSDSVAATDETLVQAFLCGKIDAFEELVRRYSRPVLNFVYRMVGNYEDANDLAQDVFVQIYKSLPASRSDLPFKPWLYVIARNKSLDLLKRKRPLLFTDIEGDDESGDGIAAGIEDTDPLPDEVAERKDLQRVLQAMIEELPPKYRQVVVMRYAAELSFDEISKALGLPENTVKTHFHRAKAMLRAKLTGLV
jgi:RNA polymerase sigma factor (sigma-70 family)